MNKRFAAGMLAFAAFTGLLTGCGNKTATENTATENTATENTAETSAGGTIIITLHPEDAPITCENFQKLVEQGFYNGTKFHRVVNDFMAQGGAPNGADTVPTIKGEFSANGVQNDRKHVRGTVSMARTPEMDSASSQFFICYTTCDFLDGKYAAFGEVTEGMEVVDDFLKVERSLGNDGAVSAPNTPIIMEKVQMIDADADGHPRVEITMDNFLG